MKILSHPSFECQLDIGGNVGGTIESIAIEDTGVNLDSLFQMLFSESTNNVYSERTIYTGPGTVNFTLTKYIKNVHRTDVHDVLLWDTEYSIYALAVDTNQIPSELIFLGRGSKQSLQPPLVTAPVFDKGYSNSDKSGYIRLQTSLIKTNDLPYVFAFVVFASIQTDSDIYNFFENANESTNGMVFIRGNKNLDVDRTVNEIYDDDYEILMDTTLEHYGYLYVQSDHRSNYTMYVLPAKTNPRNDIQVTQINVLILDYVFIKVEMIIENPARIFVEYITSEVLLTIPEALAQIEQNGNRTNPVLESFLISSILQSDGTYLQRIASTSQYFVYVRSVDVTTGQRTLTSQFILNTTSGLPTLSRSQIGPMSHADGISVNIGLNATDALNFTFNLVVFNSKQTSESIVMFFQDQSYNDNYISTYTDHDFIASILTCFNTDLNEVGYIDTTTDHYVYVYVKNYHNDDHVYEFEVTRLSEPEDLDEHSVNVVMLEKDTISLRENNFVADTEIKYLVCISDISDGDVEAFLSQNTNGVFSTSQVLNENLTFQNRSIHDVTYLVFTQKQNTLTGQKSMIKKTHINTDLPLPVFKEVSFYTNTNTGILFRGELHVDDIVYGVPYTMDVFSSETPLSNALDFFRERENIIQSNTINTNFEVVLFEPLIDYDFTNQYTIYTYLKNELHEKVQLHYSPGVTPRTDMKVRNVIIKTISDTVTVTTTVEHYTNLELFCIVTDFYTTIEAITPKLQTMPILNVILTANETDLEVSQYYNNITDTLPTARQIGDGTYHVYVQHKDVISGQLSTVGYKELIVNVSVPVLVTPLVNIVYGTGVRVQSSTLPSNELPYHLDFVIDEDEHADYTSFFDTNTTLNRLTNQVGPQPIDVTFTNVYNNSLLSTTYVQETINYYLYAWLSNGVNHQIIKYIIPHQSVPRTNMEISGVEVKEKTSSSITVQLNSIYGTNLEYVWYVSDTQSPDTPTTTTRTMSSTILIEEYYDSEWILRTRNVDDTSYYLYVSTLDITTGQFTATREFVLDVRGDLPNVTILRYSKSYPEQQIEITTAIRVYDDLPFTLTFEVFPTPQDVTSPTLFDHGIELVSSGTGQHTLTKESIDVDETQSHYGYLRCVTHHFSQSLTEIVIAPNLPMKREDLLIYDIGVTQISNETVTCGISEAADDGEVIYYISDLLLTDMNDVRLLQQFSTTNNTFEISRLKHDYRIFSQVKIGFNVQVTLDVLPLGAVYTYRVIRHNVSSLSTVLDNAPLETSEHVFTVETFYEYDSSTTQSPLSLLGIEGCYLYVQLNANGNKGSIQKFELSLGIREFSQVNLGDSNIRVTLDELPVGASYKYCVLQTMSNINTILDEFGGTLEVTTNEFDIDTFFSDETTLSSSALSLLDTRDEYYLYVQLKSNGTSGKAQMFELRLSSGILVDFVSRDFHNQVDFVVHNSEAVLVDTDVLYSTVPGLFLDDSSAPTALVFSAEFPSSSFDTVKTNHEIRINQEWIHGSHLQIGYPPMLMNSMLEDEESRRAIICMDFTFSNFDESESIVIGYDMHYTRHGRVTYAYYKNEIQVFIVKSGLDLNKVWGLDTQLPSYLSDSLKQLTLGRRTWVFKHVDDVLTMYITHESNLVEIAHFENINYFPSMSNLKIKIHNKYNRKSTYENYLCHSVHAYEW